MVAGQNVLVLVYNFLSVQYGTVQYAVICAEILAVCKQGK
jgi:hypothetical protein